MCVSCGTSSQQKAGESCETVNGDRQGNSKDAEGNRPADAEKGKSQNCTGRTAQGGAGAGAGGGAGGECTEEKRPDEKDGKVGESCLVEEGDRWGNDKAADCKKAEGVPSEGADVLSYQDQQSNQLKALSLSSFYNFSSAGDKEREGRRAKGRDRN
jgi:hypothetical protein